MEPSSVLSQKDIRATIKVCMHRKCVARGSAQILANLKAGFASEEAIVLPIARCFGFCAEGPNIAINDNIVKGIKPFLAVETARQELHDPSCKADGLGHKTLEDLDAVLDDMTSF
ncbi:MAG: (2Fe-2S) ferredoxin domain-containing protein [Minisyncoccota bacterium]